MVTDGACEERLRGGGYVGEGRRERHSVCVNVELVEQYITEWLMEKHRREGSSPAAPLSPYL